MRLLKFIQMGGVINWILFAIACVCCVQICERAIYFFQTRGGTQKSHILRLQKTALALKANQNISDVERKTLLEKEAVLMTYEMGRGLWLLNFLCNFAPSLGLLGTVTGLISAFKGMASGGAGVDVQNFAGGIWEAMLTTATGLVIAIPGSLCYRTFVRIIEKRTLLMSVQGDD